MLKAEICHLQSIILDSKFSGTGGGKVEWQTAQTVHPAPTLPPLACSSSSPDRGGREVVIYVVGMWIQGLGSCANHAASSSAKIRVLLSLCEYSVAPVHDLKSGEDGVEQKGASCLSHCCSHCDFPAVSAPLDPLQRGLIQAGAIAPASSSSLLPKLSIPPGIRCMGEAYIVEASPAQVLCLVSLPGNCLERPAKG